MNQALYSKNERKVQTSDLVAKHWLCTRESWYGGFGHNLDRVFRFLRSKSLVFQFWRQYQFSASGLVSEQEMPVFRILYLLIDYKKTITLTSIDLRSFSFNREKNFRKGSTQNRILQTSTKCCKS